MREINYQLFDKVSGLPIESLSNECIREFAERWNKSYSEMFMEMKEEVRKHGIRYMIPGGTTKIKAIVKGSLSACNPTYYDNYEDAVNFVLDQNNE